MKLNYDLCRVRDTVSVRSGKPVKANRQWRKKRHLKYMYRLEEYKFEGRDVNLIYVSLYVLGGCL